MIFYVAGASEITSSKKFNGPVIYSNRVYYQLDNAELVELDDPTGQCHTNEWFNIHGKDYQLHLSGPGYQFSHAEQGNISLVDAAGQKLEVPPEIAYLAAVAMPRSKLGSLVVGGIRRYKGNRGESLFLADIGTKKFIYRENISLSHIILQADGIYGYSFDNQNYVKLDHELNDVWAFDPNPRCRQPKPAIPYKDSVVFYAGSGGVEALGEVEVPGEEDLVYNYGVLRDGELYCLDRDTGEKRWERVFPNALNDMVLHEDKIYCVADKELFRLSFESGEIEAQELMEFSAGGETLLYKVLTIVDNKLWITINYWLHKTYCLLVVNPETLAIEHKIDMPEPYVPDRFLFYDERNRQVFYRLRQHYGARYMEHRQHLLVLHLDDLKKPITFEEKPDIAIEFKPAADNKDLEELWIRIKDTPLYKALRFGIIETQSQTSLHASVPTRRTNRRETFNGRVHFRYSGSDRPKEEVEEQLQIIESSFNDWARRLNVTAGTGSGEPVSIDVVYV